MNFEDILKGSRFERSHDNLMESAEKTDALANKLEESVDSAMGFLEGVAEFVSEFVENLRHTADALREEAQTKTDDVYDKVKPAHKAGTDVGEGLNRQQKIDFIVERLGSAGIVDSKWVDPKSVSIIPDSLVNYTYKAFGGK